MSQETRDEAPMSDELVGDAVLKALEQDEAIEAGEILVEVKDGVVTLTGDVPERRMKKLAEQCAAAVEGVREVRDLIEADSGSHSFGPRGAAVKSADYQGGPGSTAEADMEEDG